MKNLMRMSFLLMLSIASVNCSKDETPTITNLDFTVTTGDNARDVIVDPSATGAENFNIYFDFSNDPNSFETSSGDAVTYTYPASDADYTIKVVATNSNGAEDVELTKSHNVTLPRLMAGFEVADEFVIAVDNGMSQSVVSNPNSTGNDSANVLTVVSAGGAYEAIKLYPAKAIDMTQDGNQTISFDLHKDTADDLILAVKLEGTVSQSDDIVDVEVSKTISGSGWQNISFNFNADRVNSYPKGVGQPEEQALSALDGYEKMIVFIGFGTETTGTYYVDNIRGGVDGISIPDTDGDTVIDSIDGCRTEVGTVDNNGCPEAAPLVLTLTAPTGAAEAKITGPWWGWSQDGPIGVSNGDDTFTFTFDPAPTENMEYKYIVDGEYEDLIDNAVNSECSARIDAGRMNTDYSGYANRIWIRDSGNFSEVYSQCD
jgi:hypothetical protein